MGKSGDLDIGSTTSSDDGLNLSTEPLGRLLAVGGGVVPVVEVGEGGERVAEVGGAQLGDESLHCSSLVDGARVGNPSLTFL